MVPASNLQCTARRKDGNIVTEKSHHLRIKCKRLPAVGNWMVVLLPGDNETTQEEGFPKFF